MSCFNCNMFSLMSHSSWRMENYEMSAYARHFLKIVCPTCLTKFGQSRARACWALVSSCLRCSSISLVWSSLIRPQSNSSQFGLVHAAQILAASHTATFVASSPCLSKSSVAIYELVINNVLDSHMRNRSSNLYNRPGHRVNVTQRNLEDLKFHLCNLCW